LDWGNGSCQGNWTFFILLIYYLLF
jgi:hypothetical protein